MVRPLIRLSKGQYPLRRIILLFVLAIGVAMVNAQSDVCATDCANFTASYNLCQTLTDDESQYLCTCDAYKGIGDSVFSLKPPLIPHSPALPASLLPTFPPLAFRLLSLL